ncbi:uncharacterized protein [Narcine bancroftii]|uniref:uncharacterized protein isoform X2 n=1 Tax=Narcine bancroftii TaxID=1343680 RepID=UPI0038310BE2
MPRKVAWRAGDSSLVSVGRRHFVRPAFMAPPRLSCGAVCLLGLMTVRGILPYEYRIIAVAIAGFGCMLTSVSAFMLSTVFRYRDKKVQRFLIVLCLIFTMASLIMLLGATILWIVKDGWIIEAMGLLIFLIIFMFTPVVRYIGRRMNQCQCFWSNNWLPILFATFVHVMIIATVILIMKKYEFSEEGCASEWPLVHGLLGALAAPFLLCIIVFVYTNPDLLGEQTAEGQVEVALVSTNAPALNGTISCPITSLPHSSAKPCMGTLPSPGTWSSSPATSHYDAAAVSTPTTHKEQARPCTSTPLGMAEPEEEDVAGPCRCQHGQGTGRKTPPHEFMGLFRDEFSRTEEAATVGLGDLFTALADMQASFYTDLHNIHRNMQSDIVDLESKIQIGFAGLQYVLQNGIADHVTALQAALGKIQDALCAGLSDIRDAINIGINQGDSSIQKVHSTMLEGLAQISEETDSVVSLLTEMVENKSPSLLGGTETSETQNGVRDVGDAATNRPPPATQPRFPMDSPSHTSSTTRAALRKVSLVRRRKSSRIKKL